LLEGPVLGLPEGLAIVEGLPTAIPTDAAPTAWIPFWRALFLSWYPPLVSPYATGAMVFGLALYFLIVGTLLTAALTS
jgi:hypothetical protein